MAGKFRDTHPSPHPSLQAELTAVLGLRMSTPTSTWSGQTPSPLTPRLPLPSCSMFWIPISERNLTAGQGGQHSLTPVISARYTEDGSVLVPSNISAATGPILSPPCSGKSSWPSPINSPQAKAILTGLRHSMVSVLLLATCHPSFFLSLARCHSLITTGNYSVGFPTRLPSPAPPKTGMARGSEFGSCGK